MTVPNRWSSLQCGYLTMLVMVIAGTPVVVQLPVAWSLAAIATYHMIPKR